MRAELPPIPYWGWFPTSSPFLVALLPQGILVDDGTAGRRRPARPSITWLSRSPFAEDAATGAGEADVEAEAESAQRENENAFTEAASLSRTGHPIVAQFRAVTAGDAGVTFAGFVANAAAGVALSSTPPPAPIAPTVLPARAAGAGLLGRDEGFIAVGRGSARQETSSENENLYASDPTHVARSADDVVEDTQTQSQASRGPSAERPHHTANMLHPHSVNNMTVATQLHQHQHQHQHEADVELERNHEGYTSEAHADAGREARASSNPSRAPRRRLSSNH